MRERIIQTEPSHDEWKIMMNAIMQQISKPVIIPAKFGEHMITYFTDVLPPILWSSTYVLSSEPYDFDDKGNDRYIGFYKKEHIYYGIITTIVEFKNLVFHEKHC